MPFQFTRYEHWYHQFRDRTVADELIRLTNDAAAIVTVGWRHTSGTRLFDVLGDRCTDIRLVEIYAPNLRVFQHDNVSTVLMDIRDFRSLMAPENTLLIWQHGPQHLEKKEAVSLLEDMQTEFSAIVIETPRGEVEQEEIYGNDHDLNRSVWDVSDSHRLGFTVTTSGDQENLIGFWKR